jgi:hypothetical protein
LERNDLINLSIVSGDAKGWLICDFMLGCLHTKIYLQYFTKVKKYPHSPKKGTQFSDLF